MEEVRFEVLGSASEPYGVIFVRRNQTNLSAYCSCPAGENGQYCKHRFGILEGKTNGIVSGNEGDVSVIQSWLPGTDIENAFIKMRALEEESARIKKELAAAKKAMARAMRD